MIKTIKRGYDYLLAAVPEYWKPAFARGNFSSWSSLVRKAYETKHCDPDSISPSVVRKLILDMTSFKTQDIRTVAMALESNLGKMFKDLIY